MKATFAAAGYEKVKFVRGHRYIGGHIGSTAMRGRWLDESLGMQTTLPCRNRGGLVAATFVLLEKLGPMFEYYPEPDKSIVVCPLAGEAGAKATFAAAGYDKVKFVRGHRYIGGHIGSTAMRDRWLNEKVEEWTAGVETLAKIAANTRRRHTRASQSCYKRSGSISPASCQEWRRTWSRSKPRSAST